MYERCAVCDLKYEREPGYFLGAMYISYGLGVATIAILGLALWILTSLPLVKIIVGSIILFLPLAFPLTLLARVLWIYLDQSVDPEKVHRPFE